MNRNPIETKEKETEKPDRVNFAKWTVVIFVANAVGTAIFTGLAGLALNLPARTLWVPYTMLLFCGLVLSPLLYWARLAREQPKSCAIRLAITFFLYSQVVMLALGVGAIRLGILSSTEEVDYYAPCMIPFTALTSVLTYVLMRRRFEARKSA